MLASAGVSALFHARSQHATHGHPLTIVADAAACPADVLDLVDLDYVARKSGDPIGG